MAARQARGSLRVVPTVVLDPPPIELTNLIQRRRDLGQDHFDEVWDGVLHMNPSPHGRHARIQWQLALLLDGPARAGGLQPTTEFNLGSKDDYRVPDGGLHRAGPDRLYYDTAALVIEIVSPGDETWAKLPFYAAHYVDEVVIVDQAERRVDWLGLAEGRYAPREASALIAVGPAELTARIDWP
jgi:Uma2 family endonuclease